MVNCFLQAFWPIFVDYLARKTSIDENAKKAWLDVGKAFAEECLSHLKTLGLPH